MFDEFLKNHEGAVIAGTFALMGVVITLIANFVQKWMENKHSLKIKQLELAIELEKEHLFDPVIKYLEHDLGSMQKVYNLIFFDKKERNSVKIDNSHLSQLSAIQARVRGLGDLELNNFFSEFSRKRVRIGNAVEDRDKDPYEELQGAIDLAGKIMNCLFVKLKKIKN